MATDYGSDVSTFPDLDPTFALITGPRVIAEAVARRLMTPRGGGLHYDLAYGYDVRSLLNGSFSNAQIAAIGGEIEQEVLKDERVLAASVTMRFTQATGSLLITIALTAADGPFTLVLDVTAVSVSILRAQ